MKITDQKLKKMTSGILSNNLFLQGDTVMMTNSDNEDFEFEWFEEYEYDRIDNFTDEKFDDYDIRNVEVEFKKPDYDFGFKKSFESDACDLLQGKFQKLMSQSHSEYVRDLMEERIKTANRGSSDGLTERTAESLDKLNKMIENDEVGSEAHVLAKKAGFILYDLMAEFEEEIGDEKVEEIEELVSAINNL